MECPEYLVQKREFNYGPVTMCAFRLYVLRGIPGNDGGEQSCDGRTFRDETVQLWSICHFS